jgi:hypothetical protein
MEVQLEEVFSMWSVPSSYLEDTWGELPVLSAIETWCERWNIKINEDKTQAIYFSRRLRPPETYLTLNGRNIPFVNHVKYLGVIFDKEDYMETGLRND